MGIILSGLTPEEKEQKRKSLQIDTQLTMDKLKEAGIVKLLLLGAGECGKSTVLKQMKILHSGGFTEEESEFQRQVIIGNIYESILCLLDAMNQLNIKYADPVREADEHVIQCVEERSESRLSQYHGQAIQRVWNDNGVQACYQRRNEFQLNDSSKYFLDSLDRIMASDYTPSQEDILQARAKTSGIVHVPFLINFIHFSVVDVGGQRSERRKWIHCFDYVDSIIFIAAVSEYNQVLRENNKTNRMMESLNLFDSVSNSKLFRETTVILFLNKIDLLEKQIKNSPLQLVFPEYTGGENLEAALSFFKDKFSSFKKDPEKQLFIHPTCATDTGQMTFILESAIDTIIQKNIKACGFE